MEVTHSTADAGWQRYIVTYSSPLDGNIMGVFGRVVEVGASLVRIVPGKFKGDVLPPGVEESQGTLLVKRSMILLEMRDPSVYDVLVHHEASTTRQIHRLLAIKMQKVDRQKLSLGRLEAMSKKSTILSDKLRRSLNFVATRRERAATHMVDYFIRKRKELPRPSGLAIRGLLYIPERYGGPMYALVLLAIRGRHWTIEDTISTWSYFDNGSNMSEVFIEPPANLKEYPGQPLFIPLSTEAEQQRTFRELLAAQNFIRDLTEQATLDEARIESSLLERTHEIQLLEADAARMKRVRKIRSNQIQRISRCIAYKKEIVLSELRVLCEQKLLIAEASQ